MAPDEPKLSKVESIKAESGALAGTIEEVLQGESSHFEEADYQLLKFHGTYQQDNRDTRIERKRAGLDKDWIFMVRAKLPGGRLSAEQYLGMDEIARQYSYGSIRLTSRQGIQFHGVGKENLKSMIRAINDAGLTTLGACGDVNRNVMCCAVSDLDWRSRLEMDQLAVQIAERFAPQSTSYWEIWCDGEKAGLPVTPSREEPIYGKNYLPRKFKMAVGVAEDNCVDLYTQDIGAEAVHQDGRIVAYDLIVGGGMGFSHGKEETEPLLGKRLVRVEPSEALEVIEEIVKLQRDHGNRADRKQARLKYLVRDRGADWLREELSRRLGRELAPAGPMPEYQVHDHLGWHQAVDGSWFVGIHIPHGRIRDADGWPAQKALREIIDRFKPQVRITPKSHLILAGVSEDDRAGIEAMLVDFGLHTDQNLQPIDRLAMACVALPTCGLALAESERYLPKLVEELIGRGLGDAPVEIRMTGCPNSCVRSPVAEIGVIGRGPGKYALFLGGNQQGTRLAFKVKEIVKDSELADTIERLIAAWREQTRQSVAFGDWAAAQGPGALAELID